MGNLAEDRVFDGQSDSEDVYVGTGRGVAVVAVSQRIGRFHLDRECTVRDLAVDDGLLAVATDEDVLLADVGRPDDPGDGTEYTETGFGPASAVGFDDGALVAATGDEYEIGRLLHPREDPTDWLTVADVDAPVRAIDGSLLAAGDGVYRLTSDELVHAGLDDARDVANAGQPLAATGDGLYRLGNGWLDELDGAFGTVETVDSGVVSWEQAYAATDDAFYEYDGGWIGRDVPAGSIVDVTYGAYTYAVTADGTLLVDRDDRWETQLLGLPDVTAAVVP